MDTAISEAQAGFLTIATTLWVDVPPDTRWATVRGLIMRGLVMGETQPHSNGKRTMYRATDAGCLAFQAWRRAQVAE